MAELVEDGRMQSDADAASVPNLFLRGKTYYCRVQILGRDSRVSLRTSNLKQAKRERARLLRAAEQARADPRTEGREGWAEAVATYCEDVLDRDAVAPSTAERYRDSLRQVGPMLKKLALQDIGSKVIAQVVRQRQAMGVTNATVKRDLTAISQVLDFAIARGVEGVSNAALSYPRRFLSEARVIIVPPTDVQVEQAATLLRTERIAQWPALVRWLRATGMRIGETLSARRSSLSWDSGCARLTIGDGKGARRGRARTIVLAPAAAALLPNLGSGILFDGFAHWDKNTVSTTFGKLRQKRGLPPFSLHALRHAYAVETLRANPTHLWRISRHLGHTTTAVTIQHYLAFLSEEQQFLALNGHDTDHRAA